MFIVAWLELTGNFKLTQAVLQSAFGQWRVTILTRFNL